MRSRGHWLPRAGASESEYEDAFEGPLRDGSRHHVANADGATESAYAGQWARALVAAACSTLPLAQAIEEARRAFAQGMASSASDLPWYANAKMAEGAHACVLAVTIEAGGQWSASAVGDCCLLLASGEGVRFGWPIGEASAFDHRPDLVSSRLDKVIPEILHATGVLGKEEMMLLCTDAVAAYVLERGADGVIGLDEAGFEKWVERARRDGMRNDDVTVIEVRR